jgi:hypothetical protein
LTFHIEGGLAHFPGLAVPRTIDRAAMPPREAATLQALLAAPPAKRGVSAQARGADQRRYVITVGTGKAARTIELREPLADAALARLVAALRRSGA